MKIIKQNTKTLQTKDNGRSSDAVSPNFLYGCLGGCMNSYCYVGRFNPDKVYVNENTEDILSSIDKWVSNQTWPKIANQCDPTYYTIDIGCSTDVALMQKHYDWQKVFTFFNNHPKLKSTFATKYPTMFDPKDYDIDGYKNRIRVSLMPQEFADILEPNTDKISDRIDAAKYLMEHMEVHINFSPIIYHSKWLELYRDLFRQLRAKKINVKCECIFLTHNYRQHERNSEEVQELLWKPGIQEVKHSNYSAENIRYKYDLKNDMIGEFKRLYSEFFDTKNIRYIF